MRDDAMTGHSILPMTLEKLGFAAGDAPLLSDVTLTLAKGGITAVIGPNGAGKSLLLRCCHGLLRPTAGVVRFRAEPRHRHAMVFQRPVMLRRSALGNISHAVRALGLPQPERRAREALQAVGLESLAERPARLLSGGEQQRLAIARAAALSPELLFLDEPTSQLDPGATRQIEEIIQRLAASGMTLLMATHDLGQARRLSARVLFLHRGRLVEDAPTQDFFARPQSQEARAFIAGDLVW